jgi:hypothetical protein
MFRKEVTEMLYKLSADKQSALIEINSLANLCGHFYNGYLEKNISANNGYNCNHPEQSEVENGCGCCYTHSCPLGYEADEKDCKRFGFEFEEGAYLIVQNKEILKLLISKENT